MVGCEPVVGLVEMRRVTEVLMMELTADDWVDKLERRLEHWRTVGSW